MRLHRYLSAHRLTELANCEFYASPISAFNDPFEFSFRLHGEPKREALLDFCRKRHGSKELRTVMPEPEAETGDEVRLQEYMDRNQSILAKQLRAVIHDSISKKYAQFLEREIRVVCFCNAESASLSPKEEILMWSHYADGHTGFRIEIDIPDDLGRKLYKVSYSPELPDMPITEGSSVNDTAAAILASATRKSTAWAYEQEVRLILSRQHDTEMYHSAGDKIFVPFKPEWIKSVDLGCNVSPEFEQAIGKVLREKYTHKVSSRKAYIHQREFRLLYEGI